MSAKCIVLKAIACISLFILGRQSIKTNYDEHYIESVKPPVRHEIFEVGSGLSPYDPKVLRYLHSYRLHPPPPPVKGQMFIKQVKKPTSKLLELINAQVRFEILEDS